ncbi:MAG: hypothetical protein ACK5WL_00190 [Pseudanabaena sp.]
MAQWALPTVTDGDRFVKANSSRFGRSGERFATVFLGSRCRDYFFCAIAYQVIWKIWF